jgi:hypothetical protein
MTIPTLLDAADLADEAHLYQVLDQLEIAGCVRAAIRRNPATPGQITGVTITLSELGCRGTRENSNG